MISRTAASLDSGENLLRVLATFVSDLFTPFYWGSLSGRNKAPQTAQRAHQRCARCNNLSTTPANASTPDFSPLTAPPSTRAATHPPAHSRAWHHLVNDTNRHATTPFAAGQNKRTTTPAGRRRGHT